MTKKEMFTNCESFSRWICKVCEERKFCIKLWDEPERDYYWVCEQCFLKELELRKWLSKLFRYYKSINIDQYICDFCGKTPKEILHFGDKRIETRRYVGFICRNCFLEGVK